MVTLNKAKAPEMSKRSGLTVRGALHYIDLELCLVASRQRRQCFFLQGNGERKSWRCPLGLSVLCREFPQWWGLPGHTDKLQQQWTLCCFVVSANLETDSKVSCTGGEEIITRIPCGVLISLGLLTASPSIVIPSLMAGEGLLEICSASLSQGIHFV